MARTNDTRCASPPNGESTCVLSASPIPTVARARTTSSSGSVGLTRDCTVSWRRRHDRRTRRPYATLRATVASNRLGDWNTVPTHRLSAIRFPFPTDQTSVPSSLTLPALDSVNSAACRRSVVLPTRRGQSRRGPRSRRRTSRDRPTGHVTNEGTTCPAGSVFDAALVRDVDFDVVSLSINSKVRVPVGR